MRRPAGERWAVRPRCDKSAGLGPQLGVRVSEREREREPRRQRGRCSVLTARSRRWGKPRGEQGVSAGDAAANSELRRGEGRRCPKGMTCVPIRRLLSVSCVALDAAGASATPCSVQMAVWRNRIRGVTYAGVHGDRQWGEGERSCARKYKGGDCGITVARCYRRVPEGVRWIQHSTKGCRRWAGSGSGDNPQCKAPGTTPGRKGPDCHRRQRLTVGQRRRSGRNARTGT